ncbi:hypothetical protein [Streptomyces lancefieldiae]|uniref:Secreted protein n=1 Tax=Streptomyces lancefieldiae TaxID=3075520 RepID=A0ABU3AI20_9ACTN|nr:hypothetical protein [Streptomyces sp. DSM 40712]MDT0609834.1 hypothetical protein [Streptomyces sp. DSM 40712]
MSPVPPAATVRAARTGRRGAWLRALVLLLALLVPCTHVTAQAPSAAAVGSGGAGGAAGEYDHLETVARAPARVARRVLVPPPLPPFPAAARRAHGSRALTPPVPTGPPPSPRSVVLRC